MKPDLGRVLQMNGMALLMEIGPKLGADYSSGSLNLMAMMLLVGADEYERGADVRALENRELKALFGDVAPEVGDVQLRGRLDGAAGEAEGSLTISALDAENDRLKKLLIEMQADIEEQTGDKARAMERRIWQVIRAGLERLVIDLPALG